MGLLPLCVYRAAEKGFVTVMTKPALCIKGCRKRVCYHMTKPALCI